MSDYPAQADKILADRAGVNNEEFQLFKEGTKIFTLEENLEAFSEGDNMKHLPYAAFKITDFLVNKLKSIDNKPSLTKIFNQNFIKAYAVK